MFVLTVLALAAVATLAWVRIRGERPGRHQRSRLGPVRGDGSGWTQEGVAKDFSGPYSPQLGAGSGLSGVRGPEDDPAFLDHLSRLNRANRPEPPGEA